MQQHFEKGRACQMLGNKMYNYWLHLPLLREATSLEERDQFYPKTELSWCKYQSDMVNGTSTYKHKPGIHTTLRKLLIPVFKNLSINELLSTCLHGKTQNNNKSLNSIISKRCPKYIFAGCTTLSMGVSSAVINFNNGTHVL